MAIITSIIDRFYIALLCCRADSVATARLSHATERSN